MRFSSNKLSFTHGFVKISIKQEEYLDEALIIFNQSMQ